MSHSSKHQLVCERTYPSGAEEWCCDTCGRRFIIQWNPEYRMIVLETGDVYAIHNAGKGAIAVQKQPQRELDPRYLAPWEEWLSRHDQQ